MKPIFASVLATIALTFSAMTITGDVAAARFQGYSNKSPTNCGVVPCVIPDYPRRAPIPSNQPRGR